MNRIPFGRAAAAALLAACALVSAREAAARPDDLLDCRDEAGPVAVDLALARRGDGGVRLTAIVSAGRGARASAFWALEPDSGLRVVSGETGGGGTASEVSGRHVVDFACERWGEFHVVARVLQRSDSLNSGLVARELSFRITPDSLVVDPEKRRVEQEWVLAGTSLRQVDCWWLPLDRGESGSFAASQHLVSRPTPRTAVPASSTDLGARSGATEARVVVAVDRAGRVKAAKFMDLWPGEPTPSTIDAVLEAAGRWTFAPAVVEGEPVSALYEIWVPLTAR